MKLTAEKLAMMEEAIRKDPQYRALLFRIQEAEKALDLQEQTMTDPQRNAMWDFFDLSQEIDDRRLEIVCSLLFPKIPE